MQAKAPTSELTSQMLSLLNACLTTQALHLAARHGVADELGGGPRRISLTLPCIIGCPPDRSASFCK
jgi:hypothetical protein